MTLKKSLQTSTFLHALAFVLLFGGFPRGCVPFGGDGESDQKAEEQAQHSHDKKEEIIDKPIEQPTEITLIEETQEETELRIERARRKDIAECTLFFGGLGIVFDSSNGRIGKVYKYYPGSDAGLQVGDRIISPPMGTIKGEIGTPVDITFVRDGIAYQVRIIRGRICTKDL